MLKGMQFIRGMAEPVRTAIELSLAIVLAISVTSQAFAEPQEVKVYQAGEDGYHTYRIPVIVQAKNGDLLAFAEGRKNSAADHGDVDIVLKRSSDGGQTWSKLLLVQDEWVNPSAQVWFGNPTPVVDLLDPKYPGRIWLAFTRSNKRAFASHSDDDGHSWSKRHEITASVSKQDWTWYATGPVHAIQLTRGEHKGRLIFPCDHGNRKKTMWGSQLVYTDDHGATWKLGANDSHMVPDTVHPNECVAVELVDGRVYVNARSQHGTNPTTRAIAYSRDGGKTFDSAFAPEPQIVSPVVQNSLLRLAAVDDGDPENLLVYCGPGRSDSRRDLTVLISRDETRTWTQQRVIHAGPTAYCDLVKLGPQEFGVLFEAGEPLYREILFCRLKMADLASKR
ncbi:MAG: exo-alpha-sialidase [Pirellulales bacterium]|nr:exo-alpha-sialidase [Pirellulales bacterium]